MVADVWNLSCCQYPFWGSKRKSTEPHPRHHNACCFAGRADGGTRGAALCSDGGQRRHGAIDPGPCTQVPQGVLQGGEEARR